MRRFGVSSRIALLCALTLLGGCWFHYGFAGGGLPENIHTVAVLPFDNQTPSPEVQAELHDFMRDQLQRRLGVRGAAQDRADAVVRGVIQAYDADVPIAFSANPTQAVSATRRLQITVDVEIVDQSTGKVLFQRKGLRGEGDYAEGSEAQGRRKAIETIVNDVVEGAQSQW